MRLIVVTALVILLMRIVDISTKVIDKYVIMYVSSLYNGRIVIDGVMTTTPQRVLVGIHYQVLT